MKNVLRAGRKEKRQISRSNNTDKFVVVYIADRVRLPVWLFITITLLESVRTIRSIAAHAVFSLLGDICVVLIKSVGSAVGFVANGPVPRPKGRI